MTRATPPAGPGPAAPLKAELRRAVLARRDALPPDVRRAKSAVIFAAIGALPRCREARVVLAYCSFGSEPETAEFLRAVGVRGQALVLPRVDRASRTLELYRVDDPEHELEPGVWGIREPDPVRAVRMAPERIDFVLVPGVAFDARGGRLGYGGGFYDRLLGTGGGLAGAARVAAAFEVQLVPEVPMGAGDCRMDLVVTEAGRYPG